MSSKLKQSFLVIPDAFQYPFLTPNVENILVPAKEYRTSAPKGIGKLSI